MMCRFIEHFFRQLSEPLGDVQTRKTASILTTIANEKQRAAKEAKKGKGKQKPTLGGGVSGVAKGGRGLNADLEVYDQALDDEFDDFVRLSSLFSSQIPHSSVVLTPTLPQM